MATTKAQQRAVNKYIGNNYDRINLTIPKGRKTAVEAYAKLHGETVNGLINSLLQREIGLSDEEWKAKPETEEEAETD